MLTVKQPQKCVRPGAEGCMQQTDEGREQRSKDAFVFSHEVIHKQQDMQIEQRGLVI